MPEFRAASEPGWGLFGAFPSRFPSALLSASKLLQPTTTVAVVLPVPDTRSSPLGPSAAAVPLLRPH